MKTYEELMAFERQTRALAQVAGRLSWDQETVMPRGAAPQRAEEAEAMEQVLHARRTDPGIGEALAAIDETGLDQVGRANLRLIRRSYERATKVPASLAGTLARVTSAAQVRWWDARAAGDMQAFVPVLEEVVALKREEAAALAQGGDPYDALLDDYEPGASAAELQAMFDALRPRLVALRDRVLGATYQPPAIEGIFPAKKQMKLTRRLARTFGYDMATGRIDKAVHPFSSGSGLDVRITTRTNEADPFGSVYSTIHETGHATYEQHIDPAYLLTPLGEGVSMGVHESQSRINENQLGRSEAFTSWLFARFNQIFGESNLKNAEDFFGAVNRVTPGYIRTESDEVQYNLHILMRFDLERKLISGELAVADLEAAWNERFEADFGVKVDGPANGVLQDVHWAVGLFGYFPTYSLGNVYAGCLHKAMRAELPELDASLARGDVSPASGWLADKLQRHGGLYEPKELIALAAGETPREAPLLDYLEEKFARVYRL